jgi:hypothetical protein
MKDKIFKLIRNKKFQLIVEIAIFFGISVFVIYTHLTNVRPIGTGNDIGVEFRTGIDLRQGINPYKRISTDDLLRNEKFATLLPAYYYFLLGIAHISNYEFETYIDAFRAVIYLSQIVGGFYLYMIFRRKGHKLLGFLALAFYLLNRWNIDNTADLKQDSIAIGILMASLYYFEDRPKASYFLYGLSLAIKQIGVFILPLYLLPFLQGKRAFKNNLKNSIWILIPTLAPALTFMMDDLFTFMLSMIFSFTRAPASNASVTFGYERILVRYNFTGIGFLTPFFYMLPRAILVLLSLSAIAGLYLGKIKKSFYIFTAFLIFATFNPVVYDQYLVWAMAFAIFSVSDYLTNRNQPV